MSFPVTLKEWASMTEVQKAAYYRKVNYGSFFTGAVAGFFVGGPVGAIMGGIGLLCIGSKVAGKNISTGM